MQMGQNYRQKIYAVALEGVDIIYEVEGKIWLSDENIVCQILCGCVVVAAARDHGGHPGGGGDHALVQEVELQGDPYHQLSSPSRA